VQAIGKFANLNGVSIGKLKSELSAAALAQAIENSGGKCRK